MSQQERIYKIDQLLSNQRVVSIPQFLERLEVSLATFKRDIAFMRDRLNAPIEFDRELGGYTLTEQTLAGDRYELPGLWFSSEEIHALLTMQQLLQGLDGSGLLGMHVQPLLARLKLILGEDLAVGDLEQRIVVKNVAYRHLQLADFPVVASATLKRKRLNMAYKARSTDEQTQREISPQRINYYKGNWYLEAWCHVRNGMRIFSMDCIDNIMLLETDCLEVDSATLAQSEQGYGIFSSGKLEWARLRFSPKAARWITAEIWHLKQKQTVLEDGALLLEVPYADETEMVMDILRYGANVVVIAPENLIKTVKLALNDAFKNYGN